MMRTIWTLAWVLSAVVAMPVDRAEAQRVQGELSGSGPVFERPLLPPGSGHDRLFVRPTPRIADPDRGGAGLPVRPEGPGLAEPAVGDRQPRTEPDVLRDADPAAVARRLDIREAYARILQDLPLSVDGIADIQVRDPSGGAGGIEIAVAETVLRFDPALLPAVAPVFPSLVKASLRELGENPGILMRDGDPVGEVPFQALPLPDLGTQPLIGYDAGSEMDDRAATERCDGAGDPANCFLPTVALHNRHRVSCSGALIAPRWVMTGAHCLCGSAVTHVTVGSRVRLGIGRTGPVSSVTVSMSGRVEFFDDAFCDAFRLAPNDVATYALTDLALVELTNALRPQKANPFATIGRRSEAEGSAILQIAGFGARETDAWGGEKYVAGIAVSTPDCRTVLADGRTAAELYGCVPERELVAIDGTLRADSCHGDSGAPAYTRLDDGTLVLIALVSRGLLAECGPGGIYALVAADHVHRWIREHVPDAVFSDGSVALATEFSDNAPG